MNKANNRIITIRLNRQRFIWIILAAVLTFIGGVAACTYSVLGGPDDLIFDTAAMRYQVYADHNCSGGYNGNNDLNDDACAPGDPEYTGEEGRWASSEDTALAGALVASGLIGRDMRTGLYWSDCYDATSGGGSCDTLADNFDIGTGCTDADVLSGSCDAGKYEIKGESIDFCEALSLDADGDGTDETDWRLPTQKELMLAYINGSANNLPDSDYNYWSATEDYRYFDYAWNVGLDDGAASNIHKTAFHYARCVRR